MMKKICFVTYHNWETKRHGGFHQFARAAAQNGIETVFFSFSRPYYIALKKEERQNLGILKKLSRGIDYKIGTGILHNVTWPTLALPGGVRKFFPYRLNEWLMTHSIIPFRRFKSKWLKNTECFVFESCDAVLLAKRIKSDFPNARIIYRPSDPLWEFSSDFFNEKGEAEMISIADKVLTVNEESIDGYKYKFPKLFVKDKFISIPNGVNISEYSRTYDRPELLNYPTTACYIGSFLPDWGIIERAVKEFPDVRFIIITPHKLDESTQKLIDRYDNLFYIAGIDPSDVPKWITNCTIVLQPFPKEYGHLDKMSLGLTAKNYKAMAAKKPIVTINIPLKLSRYGLYTSDNEDDFIKGISAALSQTANPYPNFDINSRDWDKLCEKFLKECER